MPTLPYNEANDVKLFANEYVNANTINRAILRLFYNDNYLADLNSLNAVDLPLVANSILISISPTEYTWADSDAVKTTLGLSDTIFGLSDVDATEITIENNQGLVWNAASSAFISKDFVSSLTDLDDTNINAPINLQSLMYFDEYSKWINAYPGDFSVGYITNVFLEATGKVLLPNTSQIGQQVSVTKFNTSTTAYIVPNGTDKINGQEASLKSNYVDEINATIHLRTVLLSDSSIGWVTVSGDGTWEHIDTSLVPGSGIEIREVTTDDLMLQPYDVTIDNVPDASEITKGIIRIATYPEALAGDATDVCINPYQLKYYMDNYAVPFASNAEFKDSVTPSTEKAANIAQIHSMDQQFVSLSAGTEALVKSNSNNTWTYDIADFVGVGLDTTQIRALYINVVSSTNNEVCYVQAEYPDNNMYKIGGAYAGGNGDAINDYTTTMVPINKGQTSIDLTILYGGGSSISFNIFGAVQRVFE